MSNMYVPLEYNQLTGQEHLYKLKTLVAMFITYMDGDSLKTLLLAQEDDYLLKLINQLKVEGAL